MPYKIAPRREGDVGAVYSDASFAEKELGWKQLEDWRKCVSSDCDSELVLQEISYFWLILGVKT